MSSLSSLSTLTSISDSESSVSAASSTLVSHSEEELHHNRSFQQELDEWVSSDKAQQITLLDFWTALHYDSSNFNQEPFPESIRPKCDFSDIMSRLCAELHTECGLAPEKLISFRSLHECSMNGNPRDNKDQPDFIASAFSAYTAPEIHWSGVDAVVEMSSSRPRRGGHAISHTIQLLEARPDLISAFGMYVDDDGISLLLSSASGIVLSPKLTPSVATDVQLLYAFVKRLYDPHLLMVDPTIQRRQDLARKSWVFDIALSFPGQTEAFLCCGYSILASHRSIGERSHIFYNTESPAVVDGKPIRVLKDHYRHPDNMHSEAEVLHHIHAEGRLPGVVEMVYSAEEVLRLDGSPVCAGRLVKTRIGLRQYGQSFMNIRTPREALMTVYDLLEVTRLLYASRTVFHRDISDGNVLFVPWNTMSPSTQEQHGTSEQTQETCFIRYLLHKTTDPLSTNLLLIDFDQSVILGSHDIKNTSPQRLGTRRFMARAICSGPPLNRYLTVFVPPTDINPFIGNIYAQVHPNRCDRFSRAPPWHHIKNVPKQSDVDHSHRLWYEAESAFWLLFWWSVCARPKKGTTTRIPSIVWDLFNNNESLERRTCTVANGALDPAYKPLEDFLYFMGGLIRPNLRWATVAPYTDPDFLHETMQREIIKFLVKNDGEQFMDLQVADESRTDQLLLPLVKHFPV